MEFIVESDSYNSRPRLQRIRFETPQSVVELSVIAEETRWFRPEQLVAAVFRPDVPLAVARSELPRISPQPLRDRSLRTEDLPEAPRVPVSDPAELAAQEIEVRYALHRARACLGEPIEVLRAPDDQVVVRGLAETANRKAELLRALEELQAAAVVTIDIQTVEEATQAQPVPPSPAPPVAQATQVRPERLPILKRLEQYFAHRNRLDPRNSSRRQSAAANVNRSITELSNEAITIAEASLAQAWALRRLAERYEPENLRRLRPQARWLLEAMVRDHVAALTDDADRARTLLSPVLLSIAERGDSPATQPPGRGPDSGRGEDARAAGSSWESILALFDAVEQIDVLTRGLFAGAGLPAVVERFSDDGEPSTLRVKAPGEAAGDLLSGFRRLEIELRNLDLQMTADFSISPEFVTSRE